MIDNGPGFPDKVLKRAFEPYVTTKSKGTGLGLAVVKKIADEHGARVRVANLADADEADAEPRRRAMRRRVAARKFRYHFRTSPSPPTALPPARSRPVRESTEHPWPRSL